MRKLLAATATATATGLFLATSAVSFAAAPGSASFQKGHGGYVLCVTNSSGDPATLIQVVNIQLPTTPSSVTAPQGWFASLPSGPFAQWSTTSGGIATGQTMCGFQFAVKAQLGSPQTVNVTFCNPSALTCSNPVPLTATRGK